MRKIQFRGKLLHNKEWTYGSLFIDNDGDYYILQPETFEADGHHLIQIDDLPKRVNQTTVGQFTGLKDDKGVKIYEGDIVVWIRENVHNPYSIFNDRYLYLVCEVYYDEKYRQFRIKGKFDTGGGFSGSLDFNDDRAESISVTVVGNIHDNPEKAIS